VVRLDREDRQEQRELLEQQQIRVQQGRLDPLGVLLALKVILEEQAQQVPSVYRAARDVRE
jgi:hypothetical protein